MIEYEIPDNIAKFVKSEIHKEVKNAKTLEFPISYTVDRIFALMAHVAHAARPKQVKSNSSIKLD